MNHLITRRHALAAMAVAGLATPSARSQAAWPSKPLTLIVPFGAGVSPDVIARLLTDRLARAIGQPCVVDNRAGAAGMIGAEIASRAAPDGYTFLLSTDSMVTILPHIYSNLKYDPFRDFKPVTQLAAGPFYLVCGPNQPFQTVADVVAAAKEKPDELVYGSFGIGSSPHIRMALLSSLAGISMRHIPYKNSPLMDVMNGQVPLAFESAQTALPLVRSGKLRALAVTSSKREAAMPQVPTVSETLPGFEGNGWLALLAPSETPAPIIDRMNAEVVKIMQSPEMGTRMADMGLASVSGSPAECLALMRTQSEKWGRICRQYGIRADT